MAFLDLNAHFPNRYIYKTKLQKNFADKPFSRVKCATRRISLGAYSVQPIRHSKFPIPIFVSYMLLFLIGILFPISNFNNDNIKYK